MIHSIKITIKTAVLSAAVFTWFHAKPVEAQNNDMRAVMNRLNQIENQIQTISRQVYTQDGAATENGIQMPMAPSYDGSMSENGNIAAQLTTRLTQVENDIRALNGRIEEQGYTLDQMRSQFDLLREDLDIRLNALEGNSNASAMNTPPRMLSNQSPADNTSNTMSDTSYSEYQQAQTNTPTEPASPQLSNASPTNGALSFDDPSTLYDQSFQAIRNQDYQTAEAGLTEFLTRYPDHKLAGNAKYWLGETYYVRGNYPAATKVFAEGYQQYPTGNKAPDNLLKLALSLSQIGETDSACVTLGQLDKDFPNAPAAIQRRATQEGNRLNCG